MEEIGGGDTFSQHCKLTIENDRRCQEEIDEYERSVILKINVQKLLVALCLMAMHTSSDKDL